MSQLQVSPLQNFFELTETLNPYNFPVYKSLQDFTSLRLDSTTSMGPIVIITSLPTNLLLPLLYSLGREILPLMLMSFNFNEL